MTIEYKSVEYTTLISGYHILDVDKGILNIEKYTYPPVCSKSSRV
jgi:hypothetical protein